MNYNDVAKVARMYMTHELNGLNPLDYIDVIKDITIDEVNKIKKKYLKKKIEFISN